MNINKHLILLFSVLFFLFAVSVSSGCFRKNESDVKSVVRNELDQLKNLDSETTQKYIPYTELFPDATENTDLTDEINETFSLFFRKFNYKISDVIVGTANHSATVSVTAETDCNIQLVNTGNNKKEKWKIQRTNSLEDDLVGGLIADLANPDILSSEDTLTVYLDTLQKLDLKEMTSYLGVVNIMNTSDTAKNSIASALAEQIHKNFNYVIKSSSENGYNATVTTEITTFDSDSILADYQEKLDKYLASADAVIDGSQKRYEKSFEILLNSINDNTVTTVNDVDFVLINDGVSWKLQDEGNTLGNAIFGTLTDSPLETSDSEDENISADTDKQTDDNTSTESSSN